MDLGGKEKEKQFLQNIVNVYLGDEKFRSLVQGLSYMYSKAVGDRDEKLAGIVFDGMIGMAKKFEAEEMKDRTIH